VSLETVEILRRDGDPLAKGKESGLAIDLHTVDVAEFAEGKIVRITIGHLNESEAFKAVGLEE
jgi:hypothetical protein